MAYLRLPLCRFKPQTKKYFNSEKIHTSTLSSEICKESWIHHDSLVRIIFIIINHLLNMKNIHKQLQFFYTPSVFFFLQHKAATVLMWCFYSELWNSSLEWLFLVWKTSLKSTMLLRFFIHLHPVSLKWPTVPTTSPMSGQRVVHVCNATSLPSSAALLKSSSLHCSSQFISKLCSCNFCKPSLKFA